MSIRHVQSACHATMIEKKCKLLPVRDIQRNPSKWAPCGALKNAQKKEIQNIENSTRQSQ